MWVRGLGVFSTAVLLTAVPACAQQADPAPGGTASGQPYDWLSPAPLAWTQPETFNWATSPIKLNAHEYGSYNSNILNSAPGQGVPVLSDYLLTTTVGASGKYNAWSQQFFADASYTVINYRKNVGFDAHNYNLDSGVNWVASTRCLGTFTAASKESQAPQEELFGPGIDIVRRQALTETATCNLYQGLSVILNSGIVASNHDSTNSQAQTLDNTTSNVQGGLQYQWNLLEKLQFLLRYTDTNFTNQAAINTAKQLANTAVPNISTTNYQVIYNRTFSQVFNVVLSGGFTVIPGAVSDSASTPTYSITANWTPSPKWLVELNASRSITPPISVLAGAQLSENQSALITYHWTPKISLTASLARNNFAGNTVSSKANAETLALGGYGANTLLAASLKASYQVTPFTTASLSVEKTQRTGAGENISGDILLFGLDYQPF